MAKTPSENSRKRQVFQYFSLEGPGPPHSYAQVGLGVGKHRYCWWVVPMKKTMTMAQIKNITKIKTNTNNNQDQQ